MMSLWEIILIAIGVSMDAFAVSICKGLSARELKISHYFKTSVWFGGFQAFMPLLGYYTGAYFSDAVSAVDHWIAFLLLGIIGLNMVREAMSGDSKELDPDFAWKTMFAMAVATSVDAMAVGISFAFLNVNIWETVIIIGIITGLFSMAGLRLGNIFGARYRKTAELAGGIILTLMGIKILIEHTLL